MKRDAGSQGREEFRDALLGFDRTLGLNLSSDEADRLTDYYELVLRWNRLTHLTTITDPAEFAQLHVVESLFAERMIDARVSRFYDLGSGLGIPGIPVAVRRPALSVRLVEAAKKKAIFLREAADLLRLSNVEVLNQRFESLPSVPHDSAVAVRALDEMRRLLPRILDLAAAATQLLIYGGNEVGRILAAHPFPEFGQSVYLLPSSNNRCLFVRLRSQ